MKAAAWAAEGLRALTRRGWRASCAAFLFRGLLKAIAPRGRRILSNLALAYPDSTERWRRDLRRRVYEHLGWTLAEILTLQCDPTQALEWIGDVRGENFLEESLSRSGGVLFLSGHYGNWELLAAWYAQYLARKSLRHDYYIISQNTKDQDIARLISQYRLNAGIKLLPKTTSALEMVKLLKSGAHIAMLADISWNGGVVLPFMGHPCTHTTGPAVLSILASVPVVPVALYRKAPFRHAAEFFAPLSAPEAGDRRFKIDFLTRQVSAALEKIISPQPELWFWLHNRWKER